MITIKILKSKRELKKDGGWKAVTNLETTTTVEDIVRSLIINDSEVIVG